MMEDDLTLFEIESETHAHEPAEIPIRDDQVVKIRHAFENAGISSQQERKNIVDAAAARDVPSLRNLTAIEGRRIYSWLKSRETTNPGVRGSLWDEREEDTWIDKL